MKIKEIVRDVESEVEFSPNLNFPGFHTRRKIWTSFEGEVVIREVPVYGTALMQQGQCARYVRLVADEMFGKIYSIEPAWNRRYCDKLVAEIGESSLRDLSEQGVLKPGMVIGILNPGSPSEFVLDKEGKRARYTHNALYIGNNGSGEPIFAEQFYLGVKVRTEKCMRADSLEPKEIIDAKVENAK